MFITILLISLIAVLFHWGWLKKYNYWQVKRFPYLSGSFPFGTSSALTLITRYQGSVLQELYKKLSPHPYGGLYIWNQPFLLLCDPDMIRTVMTKDFQHFRDRGRVETSPKIPLSEHLFDISGDLWKFVRVKLTPTFTSGRIKNMYSLIELCGVQLDKELKKIAENEQPKVDVKTLTACFTLDTITSCAFGLDANTAENQAFRETSLKIIRPYVPFHVKIKMSLRLIFPFITKFYVFKFMNDKISNFMLNLVKTSVDYREKNLIRRNDFMDLMIQLKNQGSLEVEEKETSEVGESNVVEKSNNYVMTADLLASQCFIFFVAGFETSSSVQSYALYELAMNQDIQSRLRKEIDEVLKKHDNQCTYQALQDLHYMEQVIYEVIRKYPTLPVLTRRCTKSFQIPNHPDRVIEKGTRIIIPTYALHHDPKYFPEPDKFDPERFSPENKSSIVPYSYLPFGEGPRHCIGKRFGLLQTKMGLFTVLSKYEVLPTNNTPKSLSFAPTAVVTIVSEPIQLLIKHRKYSE